MSNKPWTTSEIKRFKDVYARTETTVLQEMFGRTASAIYTMAIKLGLSKEIKSKHDRTKTESRRYTTEEDERIRQMLLDGKTPAEIANEMNRSKAAILHRRIHLGLVNRNFWSEEEERFLRECYHMYRISFLSKLLNRSELAIEIKALRMGLKNE